jgi:3-dehydroquinate synthase
MVCASLLAERRRLIARDVTERQIRLLEAFALPTAPEPWSSNDLLQIMRKDKKATGGQLRFILPTRLGEVALFDNVPDSDTRVVLDQAISRGHP